MKKIFELPLEEIQKNSMLRLPHIVDGIDVSDSPPSDWTTGQGVRGYKNFIAKLKRERPARLKKMREIAAAQGIKSI